MLGVSSGEMLEFARLFLFHNTGEQVYFLNSTLETAWGSTGKQARVLSKFRRLLARMDEADQNLLLHMAQKMSRRQYFLPSTVTIEEKFHLTSTRYRQQNSATPRKSTTPIRSVPPSPNEARPFP